jgi:hypothetical protein
MKNDKNTPAAVIGYLAQNWTELNEHTPAVILNPEARPLDLMAWCWGELMALQAAADVLVDCTDEINKCNFSALIVHRLDPLVNVFELAMQQLRAGKEI